MDGWNGIRRILRKRAFRFIAGGSALAVGATAGAITVRGAQEAPETVRLGDASSVGLDVEGEQVLVPGVGSTLDPLDDDTSAGDLDTAGTDASVDTSGSPDTAGSTDTAGSADTPDGSADTPNDVDTADSPDDPDDSSGPSEDDSDGNSGPGGGDDLDDADGSDGNSGSGGGDDDD